MRLVAVAVITVCPFDVNAVTLFNNTGTRYAIGNDYRPVINHMPRTRHAKRVRVIGVNINCTVVLNDSISGSIFIQRHRDHACVGGAFCT
ncbi:Uncharacterised protein [Salmonella enterica subsp. enterica serovar Typhi]|nr:Uncharacterised protein [Salmonella enterica subsp. enterica serovar Typhi]CGW93822.1 Uncharacterised protein [Salmonella enterica subsp. enterica serovar Typhi]CHH75068.1 Uncharacterised protein [Salmonella enterica subsp. enterica serovar Typhi]